MKIVVSSFYYPNYKELAEHTVHGNLRRYCEKHGYIFHPHVVIDSFKGDGYQWLCEAGKKNAILVLKSLYDFRDCDYLFTVGADAIITNTNVKLEDLIKVYPQDIVVGTDWDGINTSQMLIKNVKRSRDYFFDIMKYIGTGGEHDQAYFKNNPKDYVFPTLQRVMNSYDCEASNPKEARAIFDSIFQKSDTYQIVMETITEREDHHHIGGLEPE